MESMTLTRVRCPTNSSRWSQNSLRSWTTTLEKTWFGMWNGNGTWWKGAHGVLTFGDDRDDSAELLRIDDERDRVLRATPTFGTPQRQYFLMSGPLSGVTRLTDAAGGTSPSLWWPDDREWFVSTEVDGLSTYVGGKAPMIDALIASSEIKLSALHRTTRSFDETPYAAWPRQRCRRGAARLGAGIRQGVRPEGLALTHQTAQVAVPSGRR